MIRAWLLASLRDAPQFRGPLVGGPSSLSDIRSCPLPFPVLRLRRRERKIAGYDGMFYDLSKETLILGLPCLVGLGPLSTMSTPPRKGLSMKQETARPRRGNTLHSTRSLDHGPPQDFSKRWKKTPDYEPGRWPKNVAQGDPSKC